MNYRTLGKTGLQVSEIGYGAWGIGKGMWIGAEDDESVKALNKAVDLGLNFIDTALVYGDGHSENLVGRVVRNRREKIYVASKIPPKNYQWPAQRGVPVQKAFPAEHVIASTEESLRISDWKQLTYNSFTFGRMNGPIRVIGSERFKSSRNKGKSDFLVSRLMIANQKTPSA